MITCLLRLSMTYIFVTCLHTAMQHTLVQKMLKMNYTLQIIFELKNKLGQIEKILRITCIDDSIYEPDAIFQ